MNVSREVRNYSYMITNLFEPFMQSAIILFSQAKFIFIIKNEKDAVLACTMGCIYKIQTSWIPTRCNYYKVINR